MALTADELAQVEANTNNSGLNSLRIAIGDSLSVYEMVDGFGDVYTDETGVNTGSSTNQLYDGTNDYYAPNGAVNMTLIGNAQTANSQPTHVRAVVLYDPVDAATLNTDAILSISRDGGTTYTQATLTKEAEYGTVDSGVVEILTTGEVDISAQPSGTSIVYKFETLNSKNIRIHGIDVKWR